MLPYFLYLFTKLNRDLQYLHHYNILDKLVSSHPSLLCTMIVCWFRSLSLFRPDVSNSNYLGAAGGSIWMRLGRNPAGREFETPVLDLQCPQLLLLSPPHPLNKLQLVLCLTELFKDRVCCSFTSSVSLTLTLTLFFSREHGQAVNVRFEPGSPSQPPPLCSSSSRTEVAPGADLPPFSHAITYHSFI